MLYSHREAHVDVPMGRALHMSRTSQKKKSKFGIVNTEIKVNLVINNCWALCSPSYEIIRGTMSFPNPMQKLVINAISSTPVQLLFMSAKNAYFIIKGIHQDILPSSAVSLACGDQAWLLHQNIECAKSLLCGSNVPRSNIRFAVDDTPSPC